MSIHGLSRADTIPSDRGGAGGAPEQAAPCAERRAPPPPGSQPILPPGHRHKPAAPLRAGATGIAPLPRPQAAQRTATAATTRRHPRRQARRVRSVRFDHRRRTERRGRLVDRRREGRLPRQRIGRRQGDSHRARGRGRNHRPGPDGQWRGALMAQPRAGRRWSLYWCSLAGGVSVRRVTVPGNEKSRNSPGPIVPGAGAGAGVTALVAGCCAAKRRRGEAGKRKRHAPFRNHRSPTNSHRLHDPEYLPGIWRASRRTGDEWRAPCPPTSPASSSSAPSARRPAPIRRRRPPRSSANPRR